MAAELEYDFHGIVEWGNRWLVTFNAIKTKLLSFNHHREASTQEHYLPVACLYLRTYFGMETNGKAISWKIGYLYR